jgi:formamidase
MTRHELLVDATRPLAAEPETGHNRWHPDITPAIRVSPGDEVFLETRDAFDGQFPRDATNEDVLALDLDRVHPLTGPVHIDGAEAGDLLEVEILDVSTAEYGFTAQSPGFGFLRDEYPEPFVVRWGLEAGFATSDDLPGVRVRGEPFMGVIGVAPSAELLRRATARERALADAGALIGLPNARQAVPSDGAPAEEGLRTIPPRENAGNVDIKQLTAGTTVLLPVFVPGALLSVGDAHFAQGDGEACGQAIEMRGALRARLGLRKGEARARGIEHMQFERSAPSPDPGPYFTTTGICVRADGSNAMEDLTEAARNALRNMIRHLSNSYGFSRQQAYAICSVAVDLKVSQLVDVPNVSVSAFLPLGIFVGDRRIDRTRAAST